MFNIHSRYESLPDFTPPEQATITKPNTHAHGLLQHLCHCSSHSTHQVRSWSPSNTTRFHRFMARPPPLKPDGDTRDVVSSIALTKPYGLSATIEEEDEDKEVQEAEFENTPKPGSLEDDNTSNQVHRSPAYLVNNDGFANFTPESPRPDSRSAHCSVSVPPWPRKHYNEPIRKKTKWEELERYIAKKVPEQRRVRYRRQVLIPIIKRFTEQRLGRIRARDAAPSPRRFKSLSEPRFRSGGYTEFERKSSNGAYTDTGRRQRCEFGSGDRLRNARSSDTET